MHCTYKRNIPACSRNHCCRENRKYYIFWVCVCSLNYPARMRMRCIILSSVTCLVPHYLINGKILGKKVVKHKTYFAIFSTTFVW